MPADRRSSKRWEIKAGEIQVVIHPGQRPCSIKDIGAGGLAIEYNPLIDAQSKPESVDILAMEYDRFYLPQITCNTVYDIATLMEKRFFKGGKIRVCGLKFVELTKEQEEKLDILLNRCFGSSP